MVSQASRKYIYIYSSGGGGGLVGWWGWLTGSRGDSSGGGGGDDLRAGAGLDPRRFIAQIIVEADFDDVLLTRLHLIK